MTSTITLTAPTGAHNEDLKSCTIGAGTWEVVEETPNFYMVRSNPLGPLYEVHKFNIRSNK
jgi:hypothetical protein